MKKVVDYFIVVIGLIMVAFAISVIIAPNSIIQGGISGLSLIIHRVSDGKLAISIINFVINLILIVIGIKILGKEFIIKTLLSVGVLSIFIELFSYLPAITDDRLLASLFGGVIYGIGIGLTLLKGASSGGTDIVGRIFQYFAPHISIGKLLMVIDGLVILCGYIIFKDANVVLYGIITLFVSTFSIDYLIKKVNVSKVAFVITDKGEEITKYLISTSGRGVTMIDIKGAYTKSQKVMLMCAMKEKEMPKFQKKIEEIDKEAFTIFCESQQIIGNGFYVYK